MSGAALAAATALVDALGCDSLARSQTDDGAILRALVAQQARQAARVDVGDGPRCSRGYCDRVSVWRKLLASRGGVLDDQARSVDLLGLDILRIDTIVADVRIRERHDLLAASWGR